MTDSHEPTHGTTPTPGPDSEAPLRDAWGEVGEQFSSLGSLVASRVRKDRSGDAEPAADADAPTGTAPAGTTGAGDAASGDAGGGASAAEQEVRDAELRAALDRFLAAGRDLGDRLVGVARAEQVRSQLREATRSLDDALTATVDVVTNRVGGLVRRGDDAGDDAGDDTPADGPGGSSSTATTSTTTTVGTTTDGTPSAPPSGRSAGDG